MHKLFKRDLKQNIAYILIVLGIIGFVSAFTLSAEKVELLKDPSFRPSCNLSPLLSCGSVMNTPQAELFGFPNPFIGIAGFTIVITTGLALLAGGKFKKWYWLGLLGGTFSATIFMTWLQYQSIYNIGALCPYCMVVWTVTIPLFVYVLIYAIRQGFIFSKHESIGIFVSKNHGNIIAVWYGIIFLAILTHFWYYWETLI